MNIMIVVISAFGLVAQRIIENVVIVEKKKDEDGTQKNGAKMTREEFHNKVKCDENYIGWHNGHELADKLYDDFESRTCENCKWCDKEDKSKNEMHYCGHPCDDMDVFTYMPLGFGCNQFERKP